MKLISETRSDYVRNFLLNMKPNQQNLEQFKKELKRQIVKSKLKLIQCNRD
jgi:hypothetical protein